MRPRPEPAINQRVAGLFRGDKAIQEAFHNRSGRVISLGRLTLAGVFLIVIWADPTQPSRHAAETYALLAAYLAAAGIYLALTWDDWALEHRLAPWAHGVDIAVFGLTVFLTEGYTSPFFAFFVFIVLSATIKWGWKETTLSALAVILLYFLAGLAALIWSDGQLESHRLIMRGSYVIVLSLVLIWFAVNQRPTSSDRASLSLLHSHHPSQLPLRPALHYAAKRTGSRRTLLVWWDKEEPWINLAALADGRLRKERHGPQAFGSLVEPRLAGATFLFDGSLPCVLIRRKGRTRRLTHVTDPVSPSLIAHSGAQSGLAIPIEAETHAGLLIAGDISGLCADDLETGDQIGREVSAAFQRASAVAVSEEAAASRTRLNLARDLHDGVIQLLAGTSFRIEAIRRSAQAGRDIGREVKALQQELDAQQRELRSFIGELKDGRGPEPPVLLCESLAELARRLERQWGVECSLEHCSEGLRSTPDLEHGLRQLMREGIANAVRHGKADRVRVKLAGEEGGLSLTIEDNGCGFPCRAADDGTAAPHPKPCSLDERARELGGILSLSSTPRGSRVTISFGSESVA